jgi:hypothetical protein
VGYYKFHTTPKTWDEARLTCQQEGGHLVVINSEAESKVLQSLFAGVKKVEGVSHNDYAFVGFHDRFVEGEYLTVFGKRAALFRISILDTLDLGNSFTLPSLSRYFSFFSSSSTSGNTPLYDNLFWYEQIVAQTLYFEYVQLSSI